MNETIGLLMNHRSIRKFNDKAVSGEIRESILKCAQMAPTSSYFQTYTIIDIVDPKKKSALAASAGGQSWVEGAPLVLLFCADLRRNQKYFTLEDKDILHNVESYTVAVTDTAMAAQKAFIAAQAYGLGGVVVGGVRNDMELMKKQFELPELVAPLYLLCLGYYDDEPLQRPRLPLEVVVKTDCYSEQGDDVLIERYNRQVSEYFSKIKGSGRTWVETCSHLLSQKPRYHVTEYMKNAGFLEK